MNEKIPVAILGATGAVGQRFIQLLADHPWFEIAALAGSERSAGKKYSDLRWILDSDLPSHIGEMIVSAPEPGLPGKIAFSALPSDIAKNVEPMFAAAGYAVCSNASTYRETPNIPLLIPELNADHISMIDKQCIIKSWPGLLVTSPNCTTTGLAMTLHPLHQAFGVRQVFVTTLQAVSGAGYPGVSFMDIQDNLIPYINSEEEKIQSETCLLLGEMKAGERTPAEIGVSVQVNRVPVSDGHTLSIALKFERPTSVDEAIQVLEDFRGPVSIRDLPSAPENPILVRREIDRPQPRRDRNANNGMSVTVGRVRPCPLLDLRMVSVVHNTLRGAASGSILNAELLVSEGFVG
ncbi:aspartate-semialdehyde dehydrogenase [Chloroflexota bacterium]